MDNVQTAAQTATPSAPEVYGSELTPAERKFFETGDVAHLSDAPIAGEQKPAPVVEGQNGAAEVDAPPEEVNPDEITIREDGRAVDKKGRFVKTVPHSVFHAKNEKLKAVQKAHDLAVERFVRADERFAVLNEAISGDGKPKATAKGEGEADIDPSVDIFGAFKQMKAKFEALSTAQSETTTTLSARDEAQRTHTAFKADVETFLRTQPDFGDAFSHLVANRQAELELMGVADAGERDKRITQEARELAQQALKAGTSPAKLLYAIAKQRGYVAKQAAATDPTKGDAAAAIERTNAAQAAALSLKGAGGGSAIESMTLKKIADMSDAEFFATKATYEARYGKPAWNRLMSGN